MTKLLISMKCIWLSWVVMCCYMSAAQAQTVSALRINELMAANVDRFVDPSWNYGGWLEIYNPTTKELNLQNLWISDDPANPRKRRINHNLPVPAHGYAMLWFGHYDVCTPTQMNMKLDPEGGTICLSTAAGRIIEQVNYPPATPRTSYARCPDGGSEWGMCDDPTPNATNDASTLCWLRLPVPEISQPSQLFTRTLTVSAKVPEGCTLRYTVDGSTPTATNGRTYTGDSLYVARTRVFRFALFKPGWLSSPVVTRSYIKRDSRINLPILSVVTDPDHLYSSKMGVFVKGINGRPGKGTSEACNWNMEWDRPVNFEYFDQTTGEAVVNMEADLSRCGGHSKGQTPMSFKLKAGKEYEGQNSIDYQFFEDKPFLKHKALQMRTGGNDLLCRIKDAALQSFIRESGLDMDLQDYVPVCHYINGEYMGTINLREPNNKHNVYANHGWKDEEIDMFEIECDSCYVQMCGTRDAWQELKTWSTSAADAATYEKIKQRVDIDELCNYMAVQFYLSNTDWPQNNCKAWRPLTENGKFRFILYDLDLTFANTNPFPEFESRQWYTFCQLFNVPGVSHYTREVELVPIFLGLLQNEHFRRHFVDAFCLVASSVFHPERCQRLMEKYVQRVETAQVVPSGYSGRNVSPRSSANEVMNNLRNRQSAMLSALENYSRLGLTTADRQPIVFSADLPSAVFEVNGQKVPDTLFSGRLFAPATLSVSAPANYRFAGWRMLNAATITQGDTVLSEKATWHYYDRGRQGTAWRMPTYNPVGWSKGAAPLGYGPAYGTLGTTINYGSNAGNKNPTAYFRTDFNVADPQAAEEWVLSYRVDDGCVIYINGVEVARLNLPAGTISYNTYATTAVASQPQAMTLTIPANRLREGTNTIAAEVHNNSGTSSDLYWCASLVARTSRSLKPGDILDERPEMALPRSKDVIRMKACFEQDETSGLPPVVINELSAGNSVFVNEYFKKNDWLELYNTTDRDIPLSGMYLTDDADDVEKYRLPDNSDQLSAVIPAHGYRVVWCDNLTPLTQLHAPFKLSNSDNQLVILTAANHSWADTLTYVAHDGTESVGRYPDGGRTVYRMYRPTIGKTNMRGSYAVRLYEKETAKDPTDVETITLASANGLSAHIAQRSLVINDDEEDGDLSVNVYDLQGQTCMQCTAHTVGHRAEVTLTPLATGMYVIRVQSADGRKCTLKIRL